MSAAIAVMTPSCPIRREVFAVASRILLGFLFFGTPRAFAATSCQAPASMKDMVRSRPIAENYAKLGHWYADHKQFSCAADAFSSAAHLQPASASMSYFWGLSLYSAGNAGSALVPLQRAAQLDPKDVRAHLVLGEALAALKRTADADSEWRNALAIDPDSSIALDQLAQSLIAQKDYRAVVVLLDLSSRASHRSSQQSLNLGIALAGTARLEDAARVLREGFNSDPASLPIANELALVLMLLSRIDEAYAVFDLALQKHPDDQGTQILYLNTLVTSHSEKAPQYAEKLLAAYPDQWEVLYLNGLVASGEGDFTRARDLVARAVAANPQHAPAQHLLGSTLAKLGDFPGAKEHLSKAIDDGDNQPEVHYELARVLQNLGDSQHSQEQMQAYQQIRTSQSGKTLAAGQAEVADDAMKAGNAEKAAALYREALESDPDEPLLLYKLSQALDKMNDTAGETDALKRAVALNPALPEAQNQLGFLAMRQGDLASAESYFRAAVQASPSYVVAWTNLAAALAAESKWKDADEALERALALDPNNAPALQLRDVLAGARPNP